MRYLTALLAACLSVASFAFDIPCLDPLACNFMEEGECFFTDENGDPCVIEGCTIEGACNFDPEADIYDGSCEFVSCLGCTDSEACNYDETALYDDATCIYYVDCNGTCGGDWIEDACGNCFAPESEQEIVFSTCGSSGMFGPSQQDCDDWYEESNIEVDDQGFQFWTVPQSGTYLITAHGAQGGNNDNGAEGGLGSMISANVYLEEGSILKIGIGQQGVSSCSGGGGGSTGVSVVDGELLVIAGGGGGAGYNGSLGNPATQDAVLSVQGQNTYSTSGAFVAAGGTNGYGGNAGTNPHGDWPRAGGGAGVNGDGISNTTSASDNGGGGSSAGSGGAGSSDNCGGDDNVHGGFGYTGGGGAEWGGGGGGGYSGGAGGASANGYIYGGGGGSYCIISPSEWVDGAAGVNTGDGTVKIEWIGQFNPYCNPGCTYPQACNYNPESNFDDGSCDYCFCGEGTQWVDSVQACMVTEAALMQACGEGTYWDDLAQACLTIETCQEDLDGDGVIGVNDLLELLSSFGIECVPEPETAEWTCGDPVNYHGYDYSTILIGDQCWFAENLRTEHYANGDDIPTNLTDSAWQYTTSGAMVVFGEGSWNCFSMSPDGDACDSAWSLNEYGRLYNWYAADDERGLCPTGWHVPTDEEWMTLEMELGMSESAADSVGYRGTDQGTQMKTTYGWFEGGNGYSEGTNGTNSSGFSGLPGGAAIVSSFGTAGAFGRWWSSSPSGSASDGELMAYRRELEFGSDGVYRAGMICGYGNSVRCIKDSE